jgi:hypothetical protein
MPLPVLPSDSGFRCVNTCMRVVLNHTKNGLSSLTAVAMNFCAEARNSSSMVGMRLVVNGPVSSIFCPPLPSANEWRTPRGP